MLPFDNIKVNTLSSLIFKNSIKDALPSHAVKRNK